MGMSFVRRGLAAYREMMRCHATDEPVQDVILLRYPLAEEG